MSHIWLFLLFVALLLPSSVRSDAGGIKIEKLSANLYEVLIKAYEPELGFRGKTVERRTLLHLPRSRQEGESLPLILSFHGGYGTAELQRDSSKMDDLSDAENVAVAYPEGLLRSWNSIISTAATQRRIHDVEFIEKLLNSLIDRFNVDSERIYAAGISNGGHISLTLADKIGHRLAAIAIVASGITSKNDYLGAARLPVMVFHGTEDRFIPYAGGAGARRPHVYLPVEEMVQHFVRVNGSSLKAERFSPYSGYVPSSEIGLYYYPAKAGGSSVAFVKIAGGGHTWPGGGNSSALGRTTTAISANRAMWEFFKRYKRRSLIAEAAK